MVTPPIVSPPASVPARTSRRRRLIGFMGLAALLVLVALAGLYWRREHNAEQSLQDALAEADRLDPGWRLAELETHRQAVAAEKNAALVVTRTGPRDHDSQHGDRARGPGEYP